MADSDSERKQRRREVYLIGVGVMAGILAQSLYDILKAIITGDSKAENADFIAGVVAFLLLFFALRASGVKSEKNPTKVDSEKNEVSPT